MIFQIELHPQALQEMEDSYQWYEERSDGLGNRLSYMVKEKVIIGQ